MDKVFEKYDHTNGPGCSLAIIKDGRIACERGYGMADLDHGIANRPWTVFHVASVSKQFTAAAVVLLAQQGDLSLDDDVRQYLPEVPDFGATITLRHLIHHTSGLHDQWSLLEIAGWRYSLDLITDQDVMDMASRQRELNFRPGEKHLYCNTGYTLLGQVVRKVSGRSLREFTTLSIFQPLGMKSTHFRDDHAEIVPTTRFRLVAFPVVFEFGPGKQDRPSVCVTGDDPKCFEAAEEAHPSAAEIKEYAGADFSEEAEVFYRLTEEGGKLVLKRLRHEPKELKPQVADVFSGGLSLRFVRDRKGRVTGLLAGTDRARKIRFRKVG